MTSVTLISIVFYLKCQIDRIEKQLSQTRLIVVHTINFILYCGTVGYGALKQDEFDAPNMYYFIVSMVFDVFQMYMHLFIIYLIVQFTRKI